MTPKARSIFSLLGLCAAFLFLMPSHESLWIDEAATARLAMTPSLGAWYSDLTSGIFSESQMPLSMFLAWVGARTIGSSEWALRAINILWGILALLAFALSGNRLRIWWLPVLLVLHPFFCYYMNEARPYALQMACGAWLFYALVTFVQDEGRGWRWAAAFSLAGLVLCGSSLLGVVPFGITVITFAWLGYKRRYRPEPIAIVQLFLCLLLLVPLAKFYLNTLMRGTGGARLWPVNFQNLLFALYELGGFVGLGPGREAMREAAADSKADLLRILVPFLPALLLLAATYFWWLLRFARKLKTQNSLVIQASIALVGLTLVTILCLAYLAHWPFWGRHLAPILPFGIAALGLGLQKRGLANVADKPLAGTFILLFAFSSFQERFGVRQAKDDYRSAALIARKGLAEHQCVWWAADEGAAHYYKLFPSGNCDPDHVLQVANLQREDLNRASPPDLVIFSKPSVYDLTGALRSYLAEHHFRIVSELPAFTIWQKP